MSERAFNAWDARTLLTGKEIATTKEIFVARFGPFHRRTSIVEQVAGLGDFLASQVAAGYSCADIGGMLGYAQSTISKWLKRSGNSALSIGTRTPSRVWSDIHRRFVPIPVKQGRMLKIRAANPHVCNPKGGVMTGLIGGRKRQEVCLRGHSLTVPGGRTRDRRCRVCYEARLLQKRTARMKPSAVQSVFAMIWRPEFDVYSMSAIARALGCSHETVQKARRLVRQGDQSLRLRMAIWDDLLAALETLEVLRAKFPETALLCNRVQHAVLQMEREGAAGLATSPARP